MNTSDILEDSRPLLNRAMGETAIGISIATMIGAAVVLSQAQTRLVMVVITAGWSLGVVGILRVALVGPAKKLLSKTEAARQAAEHETMAQMDRRVLSDRRAHSIGAILSATHHELNREITLLGFVVDDVIEEIDRSEHDSDSVGELERAFAKVAEGQTNVRALARLGANDYTDRLEALTASDLVPLTASASVVIEHNEVLYGDPGLLKLFVKNAARNAEDHGGAQLITLSSQGGRLTITDDGTGCETLSLLRSWRSGLRPNGSKSDGTQIMRRIADAHQAEVIFDGRLGRGVQIVVDLRDVEIDLRDRGLIAPAVFPIPYAVGYPYIKASQ